MFYSYCILFFIFSFLGWVMEVTLTLITDKKFVNRGFLLGPCCPIYGCGCLLLNLLLQNYVNNIIVLFILTMFTCSLLEYITSFLMEKIFKLRWWDYSQMRFNINGRICLETIIPFGLLGCFVTYVSNPIIFKYLEMLSELSLKIISGICFTIFLADNIISYNVIASFKKTVRTINKGEIKDNTEEITRKVREILMGKSFFKKRLMEAYPNLQAKIKEKAKQIAQKAKEVKVEMTDKVENVKEKITQSANELKENIEEKMEEVQKEIKKKPSDEGKK